MEIVRGIGRMDLSKTAARSNVVLFGRFRIPHVIGGGAGASVATAVTKTLVGQDLPADYTVVVVPEQDVRAWITAKSGTGFTINQTPVDAGVTLAAGSVDVLIFA